MKKSTLERCGFDENGYTEKLHLASVIIGDHLKDNRISAYKKRVNS